LRHVSILAVALLLAGCLASTSSVPLRVENARDAPVDVRVIVHDPSEASRDVWAQNVTVAAHASVWLNATVPGEGALDLGALTPDIPLTILGRLDRSGMTLIVQEHAIVASDGTADR